jgi:resuscitation-promoting factor RpfB
LSEHRRRALAKRRKRRQIRVLLVATVTCLAVIGVGAVVEVKWSDSGTDPAAAALAAIPTSHAASLLEEQRQEEILEDSTSENVKLVGTPKVATSPAAPSSSSGGNGTPPTLDLAPADPGSAQATAQSLMPGYGFSVASQWSCLDSLWERESGWVYDAENASGAYGIPQALPGDKMASAGPDWQTNPTTQIKWGLGYIQSVYGTPCAAWTHEVDDGWY